MEKRGRVKGVNTTTFTEALRYDYPLTKSSRVIDAGFYEGAFSRQIAEKYGCWIDAYEPIEEWCKRGRALKLPGVNLIRGAVGVWAGSTLLRVQGAMTGPYADGPMEETPLFLIDDVIGDGCDLLKLNIEGGEFDVLERMVNRGLASRCADIQVQFHSCVPNAEKRWKWIRAQLLTTHHLTYDFSWCWENYERNA